MDPSSVYNPAAQIISSSSMTIASGPAISFVPPVDEQMILQPLALASTTTLGQ